MTQLCAFRCLILRPQILKLEVSKSNSWKINFFLENYVTSEGAVLTMFYTNYQPLPIIRYQVRFYGFYAANYFE